MRYTINYIDTHIKKKDLQVSMNIDVDTFIDFPYSTIQKIFPSLSVYQLDILNGCQVEPSAYYRKGEKLENGHIVKADDTTPKGWKIDISGTFEELKKRNQSQIKSFQQIYSVEVSKKNSKSEYVKIRTTAANVYFTSLFHFKGLVDIYDGKFEVLTGTFIHPVMYKNGDTSLNNGRFYTINKDDKIVASFNIRFEGNLIDHHNNHGNVQLRNENYHEFNDERDRPSYEKYNGYNGFDDQTIDDAFDGDPEATWNVD